MNSYSSSHRNLKSVVKETNIYLLLIMIAFSSLLLGSVGLIFYQSNKALCELLNSRLDSLGPSMSRELALGEDEIARNIFLQLVTTLEKVSTSADLRLVTKNMIHSDASCSPGVFQSVVNYELIFLGKVVAQIQGKVKSFSYDIVLISIFTLLALLVMAFYVITKKLVQNMKQVFAFEKEARLRIEHSQLLSELATQVVHDIRSPLDIFKSLSPEFMQLPESSRRRVQMSVNRMEEIIYSLLKTHKNELNDFSSTLKTEELLGLVENILIEKRIEYSSRVGIEIIGNFMSASYGMSSKIRRSSVKRILSNMINNAVEAIEGQDGEVVVSLEETPMWNVIKISDSGKGIPLDIQGKIFSKGFTTKVDGNGIGLCSAKDEVLSYGGKIEFLTSPTEGTVFSIFLPKDEPDKKLYRSIVCNKYRKIIILDDDISIHSIWTEKLKWQKNKLEFYISPKELLEKYKTLTDDILLISDFELMDDNYDGIDVIEKLSSHPNSILCTALSEELFLRERCDKLGISLIPKSMISYLSSTFVPLVYILIDDDKFVQMSWKMKGREKNIVVNVFSSIDDFLSQAGSFNRDVIVYIDSNLGQNVRGEFEAKNIYDLGFKNIYLATGYEKRHFDLKKFPWISEVVTKAPPF